MMHVPTVARAEFQGKSGHGEWADSLLELDTDFGTLLDYLKELGVADELREIDGVTTPMMVKLGENDVKTVEDLAGCATDDLVGWTERKDGETTKHAGFLDGSDISRDEAEALIMAARVKAGWIEATPAPAEDEPAEQS